MDNAIEVISLPILTFDERKLTPSFGYVFHSKWLDPQESIVSMLWKFALMNALSGQVIARQLVRFGIDPYEGVAARRGEVDMRRLRDALGLRLTLVRGSLIPDSLQKISSPYFRFCPKCLRRGYHSVVHQFEPVHECPIHGEWLQASCRSCGRPALYNLNAHLLDAPFRCANCRSLYGSGSPQFLKRRPLILQERVAVTRLKLHYYSS